MNETNSSNVNVPKYSLDFVLDKNDDTLEKNISNKMKLFDHK